MSARRFFAVVAGGIMGMSLVAGPATAHTEVAESNPADGSTIDAPPAEVMVRFGNPTLPFHPLAITGGSLQVLDACGSLVHEGETSYDMVEASLTVPSGGSASGRYEIHWFATATDGAEQAGSLDFVVSEGRACARVARTDAADDVDLGPDVTAVSVTRASKGRSVLTITTAQAVTCSGLAGDDDLEIDFDTDYDETPDHIGRFACKGRKVTVQISDAGADEGDITQTLSASRRGAKSIAVILPRGFLGGSSLDVSVRAASQADDCGEGDVCLDRAPDLGLVRVF